MLTNEQILKIKKDFPIFDNVKGLVYLDNAATSQKTQQVIDAMSNFYMTHNANVHRGIYDLSEKATALYDGAREKIAKFIGAKNSKEIIFTSGTTSALNLVAGGWGTKNIKKDDVILATIAEHNSSILPWKMLAKQVGAKVEYLGLDQNGGFSLKKFEDKIRNCATNQASHRTGGQPADKSVSSKVKLVVIPHVSNVLGTIFPVKEICSIAKKYSCIVVVDGAQAVPHMKVNVQSLGCDFYAFSGHKMLGPMGIGVLWARHELLEDMSPILYGGGMVSDVNEAIGEIDGGLELAEIPERFEAGTPNVAGAIGLGSAIDYLESIGMENIREYETYLCEYAYQKLSKITGLKILGSTDCNKRCGLISFVMEGVHPHDIASVLSESGICVRSGRHCAMILHKNLNISSSVRASFSIYNTTEDIDKLVEGLQKAQSILQR